MDKLAQMEQEAAEPVVKELQRQHYPPRPGYCRHCGDGGNLPSAGMYVIMCDDGYCTYCSRQRERLEKKVKELGDMCELMARLARIYNGHPLPLGKPPTLADCEAARAQLEEAKTKLVNWLDW